MSSQPSAGATTTATDLAAMVEAGDCYRAYARYRALLEQGAAVGPGHHYWGIQALARHGFIVEALKLYLQVDWSGETGENVRLLPARLLKELYFQSGGRYDFLLRHSLELYRKEYLLGSRVFPGINAAFLSLVAGEREQAESLAGSVVATLMKDPAISRAPTGALSTAALYDKLTYVEASFIRGDGAKVVELLRALASVRGGRGAVDNCVRQLRRILPLTGEAVDISVADKARPDIVLTYGGPAEMPEPAIAQDDWQRTVDRLAERLNEASCIALCGALSPGFEIALAHAGLRQGARLNIVLPVEIEQFRAQLVAPHGQEWVDRFDEAAGRAEAVGSFGVSFPPVADDLERIVEEAAIVSSGLAALPFHGLNHATGHAARLNLPRNGFDMRIVKCPAASYVPLRNLHDGQRFVCSIFCDLVGASKLSERKCVELFSALYRRVSEHLGNARSLLECNTWGDAVFLVFQDIVEAAEAALEIRRITDWLLEDAPEIDSTFRIACHYGLAFEIHDAVRGVRAFTGSSVTRVARIEPVTPPGHVYVTQSFAGKLATARPDTYTLETVGQIALAKSFGRERVFNLRRANFDISERELRLLQAYFAGR